MYVQESYGVTANAPHAGPYCTSLLSFNESIWFSEIHRRREAPCSRCPPARCPLSERPARGTRRPRRSPGLKAGEGGSTQPYSCKNREKSVYQRSHMRPETGSCRTKAVIKSSVQSWRLVEEEVLAQAAALGYQHKVWRDNYTSGCRSNGA